MEVLFDYDPAAGKSADARARERADRLLALYQQVLGHDLPNVLVSVQGLARLLNAEYGPRIDPDARTLLGRLAELAHRADVMARSTAAVGRTCRDAAPATPVPLTDAVREAIAQVNILSSTAAVEYDVAQSMPVLMVSRPALHQVLVQLLGNATRAGVAGRSLRVAVSARGSPRGVELRVADDGREMPPDVLQRVGEPAAGDGPAAGLFLVRELVAGWGGALHVRSEAGRGTVVTILFREPSVARVSTESEPHSP
jgi:cell cycle sensor histidine kinase DivJ